MGPLALHANLTVDGTSHKATLPGPIHGLGYIIDHAGTNVYFLGISTALPTGGPGFCVYDATAHTLLFDATDTIAAVDVLMS